VDTSYLPYAERMDATDIPPGLDGNLVEFVKGGCEFEWKAYTKTRFYTNAFVINDGNKVSHSQRHPGIHGVTTCFTFVLPNSCCSGSRNGDLASICTVQRHFSVESGVDCLPY